MAISTRKAAAIASGLVAPSRSRSGLAGPRVHLGSAPIVDRHFVAQPFRVSGRRLSGIHQIAPCRDTADNMGVRTRLRIAPGGPVPASNRDTIWPPPTRRDSLIFGERGRSPLSPTLDPEVIPSVFDKVIPYQRI